MAVNFAESKTKENLMRAFAGESQARNRYTFSAEAAEKCGMYAVAEVFRYTADQERAHGERFYGLLKEMTGETIHIDGGYPVDPMDVLADTLRAAEHNEREEFEDVYKNFGDVAKEEGFMEVASAFYQIAEIEHIHEQRFARMADLIQGGKYFENPEGGKWICTNCGYIHEGNRVPEQCPVCRHEKGYFLPISKVPYL